MATWKKIIVSGSSAELAGLTVDSAINANLTGNVTGNLTGTADNATAAVSASHAAEVQASGVSGLAGAISGNAAVSANTAKVGFTDDLARAAISVEGDLGYDQATGILSFTAPTMYTDADARGAISVSGDLAYNSGTGVISFTERTDDEVKGLFSAGAGISYNSTTGAIASTITQYTDADAQAAISVSGDLGYADGVVSFTERTEAEVKGLFSAGAGISYNSTTGAIASTITQYTDADARNSLTVNGDLIYDPATGVLAYSSPTMYTDADAQAAISVTDNGGDGSLSYEPSTGVISYTGPSASDVRAHFSAGTGVSITDGAIAIGQAVGTSDDVTFNNLTLAGDLTVSGTTTTINTNNIAVEDRFAFFNAGGGALSAEGGIIVEGATAGSGEALFYDGISSRRWSLASNVAQDAVNVLPSAAVAAVFQGNEQEMVDAGHALVGNIRIEGGEAFIVVAE